MTIHIIRMPFPKLIKLQCDMVFRLMNWTSTISKKKRTSHSSCVIAQVPFILKVLEREEYTGRTRVFG